MPSSPWLYLAGVDSADWSHRLTPGTHQIGRSRVCDVHIVDLTVSRVHAEFVYAGDGLSVRDLQSLNGTFVNGVRIADEVPLLPGDQLRLGRVVLGLMAEPAENDSEPPSRLQTFPAGLGLPPTTSLSSACEGWGLSPAQARIAELLLRGLNDKEIAAQFHISTHTVHTHRKKIYQILGVHSRGELMAKLLLPAHCK